MGNNRGLGRHLQRKLALSGMSQAQLQQRMSYLGWTISAGTISRWISGKIKPTIDHLSGLSEALRMPEGVAHDLIKNQKASAALLVPDSPTGDPGNVLRAGLDEWQAGRTAQACIYFNNALDQTPLPEQGRLSPELCQRLLALAYVAGKFRKLALAHDLASDVLEYAPDAESRVRSLLILAQTRRDLGRFHDAEAAIEKAAAILPSVGREVERMLQSRIWMQEGVIKVQKAAMATIRYGPGGSSPALSKSEAVSADELFADAQRLLENGDDPYHVTLNMINRGAVNLYLDPGSSKAAQFLRVAVKRAENCGHLRLLALAEANLGYRAFMNRKFESARFSFRRSESCLPAIGHDDIRFHNRFYEWRMARDEGADSVACGLLNELRKIDGSLERSSPEAWALRQHYEPVRMPSIRACERPSLSARP